MTTTDVIKRLQEIEKQYGILDIRSFDSMDEAFIDGVDIKVVSGHCFITYAEEGKRSYILE